MLGGAPDDFALLDAWTDGDDKAGDALLRRHFASLFRFFSSKVDEGAEDLVQTTLMRCIESRDRFGKRSSFRTYLFTVARNTFIDQLRKRLRTPDALDFAEVSLVDVRTSPSAAAARDQEHAALIAALRALPLEIQIAVELTYWEGLNAVEVAEVSGVTPSSVRSRLTRARQALRTLLPGITGAEPG